ncbi:LysR family transcriptional regulator [Bordetella pertussis]|uniref:Transcriptional regulator n=1 Tax=Bordetella pertussis (strain Tohama I / ATCC BAA-589 / NCTC 13251) TaxID=257313 RepID=Q7W0R0_BORPE|nr:putative transcriptional regulator [Bordetella pertussis CS]AIW90633.1 transcriptional regulator [Bordetella pertussis B1917]AIW94091.1 transcriptional regulator [Bordetella pertussis B1920]AJB24916.1 transcriptional regulator [Bordetella pertussis 137]ALH47682.1 transcriptional regulator [Bordetella pertussis]AZW33367.1 LysR family transcriptional regulator [Bordetella bronchiseptica]CAE40407.1 putative transcriptional regulator [Bordetella pertussis Tohama I]
MRQVDFFTLRLFLSAVEEGQIGRAALRENIAPSAATKRIQELEDVVGLRLLERTPKGVILSPAGEVLVRHIRQIFTNVDELRAELSAFSEGVRGEVSVASARSIIAPYLAHEFGAYIRDYPLVDLIVREVENAAIVQAVAQGDADIGVFAAAPALDLSGVDVMPYRQDRMVVVMSHGHRLAQRQSVTFEDLLSENLIVPAALHMALRTAADRLGREFEPKYGVTSAGVAISLAQEGLGVTIQPECLLDLKVFEHAVGVELAESWANRSIHIATARGRAAGPAANLLLKQLLDRPRALSSVSD